MHSEDSSKYLCKIKNKENVLISTMGDLAGLTFRRYWMIINNADLDIRVVELFVSLFLKESELNANKSEISNLYSDPDILETNKSG